MIRLTLSNQFQIQQRVQSAPHTTAWMRGDRYGEVRVLESQGAVVYVLMDRSGKMRKFLASDLVAI